MNHLKTPFIEKAAPGSRPGQREHLCTPFTEQAGKPLKALWAGLSQSLAGGLVYNGENLSNELNMTESLAERLFDLTGMYQDTPEIQEYAVATFKEAELNTQNDWIFHYNLGIAYRNFCSKCLTRERNPEMRKEFTKKAVKHLEKALALSEGKLQNEYRPNRGATRSGIAAEIGELYFKDSRIQDFNQAIYFFNWARKNTKDAYIPLMNSYALLLMKQKRYSDAVELLLECKDLASMDISALDRNLENAYISWAEMELKAGRIDGAKKYFKLAKDMIGKFSKDYTKKMLKKGIDLEAL